MAAALSLSQQQTDLSQLCLFSALRQILGACQLAATYLAAWVTHRCINASTAAATFPWRTVRQVATENLLPEHAKHALCIVIKVTL